MSDDQSPLDQPHIWTQRKGEPKRYYAMFLAFRNLGVSRTVPKALGKRNSKEVSGPINSAAAKWKWQERAKAWDLWIAEKAGAKVEAKIEAFNEKLITALDESARKLLLVLGDAKIEDIKDELAKLLIASGKAGPLGALINGRKAYFGEKHQIEGKTDLIKEVDLSLGGPDEDE